MIHTSCDLCGKDLRPGEDHRYVVKIEVYAADNPCPLSDEDLDDDHLEAVSQLLRDQEDGLVETEEDEPPRKHLRYDLCSSCQKRFVKDPLNREADHSFDFSEN